MTSEPDRPISVNDEALTAFEAGSQAPIWLLLDSGPASAPFNMALDEALLESAAARSRPVLRFYGWTERAATFGYSQHYREIETFTVLRPLIRRPTGGGWVPHDADWTYSLVFPPEHWWSLARAPESYECVHAWIRDAFARIGVNTSLSPAQREHTAGQCFVGAERHDLLWGGRKIAGAAQRRNKLGLLIQGSVQPPSVPLLRKDWEWAMREVGTERWGICWKSLELGRVLRQRASQLARAKYSRAEFNRSR